MAHTITVTDSVPDATLVIALDPFATLEHLF